MLISLNNQEDIILSWSQNLIQKSFSVNSKNIITAKQKSDFKYILLADDSETEIIFDIKGEDVKWDIFAIFFGKDNIKSNIQTNILSSHCHINIYMLSLISSDHQFDINWNISLWKNISNSQWHLLEKSIILDQKVKIKAIPRLDVYSNDVKATHGLSIDRINLDEMFYLNSKWLDQNISKELIIRWYITNILNQFTDLPQSQKKEIENQILSKTIN